MFAGGDYAGSGCSVHFLPQLYTQTSVSILKLGLRSHRFVRERAKAAAHARYQTLFKLKPGPSQPCRCPWRNAAQRRATEILFSFPHAGAGLSWPVNPSNGLRQPGYFAFAGGLTCTGNNYRVSDVVDIFWYNPDVAETGSVSPWTLATMPPLSTPRNWMSATSFCTLTRSGGTSPTPVCRFMFAGGQTTRNQYGAPFPSVFL